MKILRLILLMLLTVTAIPLIAVNYTVSGNVYLADQLDGGSHGNVLIRFIPANTMIATDSVYNNTNGTYSLSVPSGYYIVQWYKPGYTPRQVVGVTINSNTVLDDITLFVGGVQYVSGEVSGIWTQNYIYYVTDDITIPDDQTLTISEGVQVLFYNGKGISSLGSLYINGTAQNPVKFTSVNNFALAGDWGHLSLYNHVNSLNYLIYEYANAGISGDYVSSTSIDHCVLKDISPAQNGLFFTNSTNLILTNNDITGNGAYGIYLPYATDSNVSYNNIHGAFTEAAIMMDYANNSFINYNKMPDHCYRGIRAYYASNLQINHNQMNVQENGIETGYSDNNMITYNQINDFKSNGIYFYYSTNNQLYNNRLITIINNDLQNIYGFNNPAENSNTIINNNYIKIQAANNWSLRFWGIYVFNSTIENDTIFIEGWYHDLYGINGNYLTIRNCDITMKHTFYSGWNYRSCAIRSDADPISKNIIENNKITLDGYAVFFEGNNSNIINNTIEGLQGDFTYFNSDQWWVVSNIGNCDIEGNTFKNVSSGVLINQGGSNHILNNIFKVYHQGLTANDCELFYKNNLTLTNGKAIQTSGNMSGEIINNTFVDDGSGDWALFGADNSTYQLRNNIFVNYQNGIHLDNFQQNIYLDYNNLDNISGVKWEGTGLPTLIGIQQNQNANGDACDIFNNIQEATLFMNPDLENFTLKPISPCVNAGSPNFTDPDQTVSDMGYTPIDISIVMEHNPLVNTENHSNPYTISVEAYSPGDRTFSLMLHFRLNNENWIELPMNAGTNNVFTATIPAQPYYTNIDYYIEGLEVNQNVYLPWNAPEEFYSFNIGLIDSGSTFNAVFLNNERKMVFNWTAPVLINGSIQNYKIYKSNNPDIQAGVPYCVLPNNTSTWEDLNADGSAYYRLSADITLNSETYEFFCSPSIPQSNTQFDLSGLVKWEYNQEIVPSIEVHLLAQDRNEWTTTTDQNGHYEFCGINPGQYRVRININGVQYDSDYIVYNEIQIDTILVRLNTQHNIALKNRHYDYNIIPTNVHYIGTFNQHDYYLSDYSTDWSCANAAAQEMGGFLVTINNQDENQYLASLLNGGSAWIGYNDIECEGNWVWPSQETPGFTAWGGGEPNGGYGENAAQLYYSPNWVDITQYAQAPFIVEFYPDPLTPQAVSNACVQSTRGVDFLISWTNPMKTVCGFSLNDLQKIVIKNNGQIIHEENTTQPGANLQWVHQRPIGGTQSYEIYAVNSHGNSRNFSVTSPWLGQIVQGLAYVDNSSNHEGISVKFVASEGTPAAYTDSTTTDVNGLYGINLNSGIYRVIFSKSGYFNQYYDDLHINTDGVIVPAHTLTYFGNLVALSGNISGVLGPNMRYHVVGDIQIAQEDSLVIQPNTILYFDNH